MLRVSLNVVWLIFTKGQSCFYHQFESSPLQKIGDNEHVGIGSFTFKKGEQS